MYGLCPSVRAQRVVVGVRIRVAGAQPGAQHLLPTIPGLQLVARGTLEPGGNLVRPVFEQALDHDLAHVGVVNRAAEGVLDSLVGKGVVVLAWRVPEGFRNQERVPYRVQIWNGRSAREGKGKEMG